MAHNNITAEDIQNYHLDDRQLFKRLVIDSGRDLVLSMHVIAFWIALEGFGFPNLVQRMIKIHDLVVNRIVDEAGLCICWLQSVTPPAPVVNVSDMPLTQELMGGKTINIPMVYTNREVVLTKMNKTIFESLAIGFGDIIKEVSGLSFAQLNVQPFVVFTPSAFLFAAGGSTSALQRTHPNHALLGEDEHLREIKRAIFFTFAHQNPVERKELESFLESSFGEGCIQKVSMQQVPAGQQPLWASVVFHSEIPVLAIMQGRETAPMDINGKQVWAGKEWL